MLYYVLYRSITNMEQGEAGTRRHDQHSQVYAVLQAPNSIIIIILNNQIT